jgi:mono/diheme cytochrome c family protein|tara:strand:+ start:254 stop:574 length:321 start_codon:yes stop_codon:yes gene_type:complete
MRKNNFYFLVVIIFINFFFLPAQSDDMFDLGKDVFLNKAVCSACHTLADAGSSGDIGPNLNEIRPDKMRVINTVTNGIGVMPPYEDQLTLEEIEAVAHYVSISATN